MAKVKQVLISVSVEVAKAKRKCFRRKTHSITKGEACLVVKDPAWSSKRNYCLECGNDILEVAEVDLEKLKADLNS